MLQSIARRCLTALLALWGMVTVVFFLLRALPGDPAETILARSGASSEAIARARHYLGLDAPLLLQYTRYLGNLCRGDLGRSLFSNRPVSLTIAEQLPSTVHLALAALSVMLVAGFLAGILAALRAGTWVDRLAMGSAVLWVSVPVFWSGLIMIMVFSVALNWLPATGIGSWRHVLMPATVLGLVGAGPLARLVRSSLLAVLHADYVVAARAKGLPPRIVVYRHALRNAFIPALNLIGLQAGFLLGGTVVTEIVFSRPGLGRLMVDAIMWKDLPVVQGVVLLVASVYVAINLSVDLASLIVDPRMRRQSI